MVLNSRGCCFGEVGNTVLLFFPFCNGAGIRNSRSQAPGLSLLLYKMEAEELSPLSHTDLLFVCKAAVGCVGLHLPFPQSLPLAMLCLPRNNSEKNILSTCQRVPLAPAGLSFAPFVV